MPFVTVKTNGFSNDVNVSEKLANAVADALGKPVSYVFAEVKYITSLFIISQALFY